MCRSALSRRHLHRMSWVATVPYRHGSKTHQRPIARRPFRATRCGRRPGRHEAIQCTADRAPKTHRSSLPRRFLFLVLRKRIVVSTVPPSHETKHEVDTIQATPKKQRIGQAKSHGSIVCELPREKLKAAASHARRAHIADGWSAPVLQRLKLNRSTQCISHRKSEETTHSFELQLRHGRLATPHGVAAVPLWCEHRLELWRTEKRQLRFVVESFP
mmetsp:Transcript_56626/g.123096  ORF Transcript_56626/g.123096 Transcript_56626/m.123096 type:complete len:216 (+) Transcript_56626:479-1126(+)